jgi:hypothetical protein
MCDVCRLESLDTVFSNGVKDEIVTTKFYRVYLGHIAQVKLCHIHAIELFCIGETRFLANHIELAMEFGTNRARFVQAPSFI